MLNPKQAWLRRNNPELFEDEDDTALRIGSAVDCLLTSPERWDTDFVVGDVFKPYGLMLKFVRNLPKGLKANSPAEMYQAAYDKAGYKKGIDWVINQFTTNEKLVEYYLWLTSKSVDRIGLTKDEYQLVMKCVETIRINEFARRFFVNNEEGIELKHQMAIMFDYELDGAIFECKALLDGVLINHNDRTIQPFDLKTTGKSVWEFGSSFLHFGYYRQVAFYEYALKSKTSPVHQLLEEGYEILDYTFIVVEKDANNPALIYVTSPSDRYSGLYGGSVGGRYYQGIESLLRAYKWHSENDYWELPRDVYENQGIVQLNIFN